MNTCMLKRYMHHCMFTFISICMYMYGNCTNFPWLLCGILVHVTMYNLNHIILLVIFISCFIAFEAHVFYLLQSIISYFPQEMWKLDYLLLSHLNLYMISRWKTLLRVFSGVNVDIYSCYECDIVSYILWCIVLNNLLWGALNKEMNLIDKWVLRWMCGFFMFICIDSLTCSVSALSF